MPKVLRDLEDGTIVWPGLNKHICYPLPSVTIRYHPLSDSYPIDIHFHSWNVQIPPSVAFRWDPEVGPRGAIAFACGPACNWRTLHRSWMEWMVSESVELKRQTIQTHVFQSMFQIFLFLLRWYSMFLSTWRDFGVFRLCKFARTALQFLVGGGSFKLHHAVIQVRRLLFQDAILRLQLKLRPPGGLAGFWLLYHMYNTQSQKGDLAIPSPHSAEGKICALMLNNV